MLHILNIKNSLFCFKYHKIKLREWHIPEKLKVIRNWCNFLSATGTHPQSESVRRTAHQALSPKSCARAAPPTRVNLLTLR